MKAGVAYMGERMMLVRDVMTREIVTVDEGESLALVEEGIEKSHFRHLPVVDGKRLVGLITHRDMLRLSSSPLDAESKMREEGLMEFTYVKDVMKTEFPTVMEHTPLVEAATMMRDQKPGCVPIVNDDGELVGIVTMTDLISLAIRFLGGK